MPRYPQLDVIRGAAIAGILLLNIVSFALPSAAYLNPAWQGFITLPDAISWLLTELFARLKFLSLFALLFGAGLVFQIPKGAAWIQSRLLWLVLFGLLHAIFLWQGDILVAWGITGLLCWRLIRDARSAQQLIRTGILFYAVGCLMLLLFGVLSSGHAGNDWLPSPADLQMEQWRALHPGRVGIEYRISYLEPMLISLFSQYGWELAGLMLIGAGLIHNGWILGKRPRGDYLRHAAWLLIPALLVELVTALLQGYSGWSFRWSGFYLQVPGEVVSPLVSLGYVALLLAGWSRLASLKVTLTLAAIGRMALSNYLLQTVVCTLIFSVAGLFMQFSRWQLLLMVPAVWLINALFSLCWLRYFRRGPMEQLWRVLTDKSASRR